MNQSVLLIIQVVISIFLIAIVLLQQKGSGLGGAFGGEGNVYRSRRGVERTLFGLTIFLAASYMVVAVLAVFFLR